MDNDRPYPEGVAFDEAWRQRQRADAAEAESKQHECVEWSEIRSIHREEVARLKKIEAAAKFVLSNLGVDAHGGIKPRLVEQEVLDKLRDALGESR